MKQALNATFFGIDLGIENDTLMTILLIALAVICVLLVILMIYILCSKKLADVVRETVKSEQTTSHDADGVKGRSSDETKKTQPATPAKAQSGATAHGTPNGSQRGTFGNRNTVSNCPNVMPAIMPPIILPPIILPPIWEDVPAIKNGPKRS